LAKRGVGAPTGSCWEMQEGCAKLPGATRHNETAAAEGTATSQSSPASSQEKPGADGQALLIEGLLSPEKPASERDGQRPPVQLSNAARCDVRFGTGPGSV